MDIIEQQLKQAYEDFKSRADKGDHDRLVSLLQGVHQDACDLLDGKRGDLPKSEIARALHILEPSLSKRDLDAELKGKRAIVKPDGTLLGTGKWELLDPGWVGSLVGWLEHLDHRAPFVEKPIHKTIPDQLSLSIAGDWGTGYWRQQPLSPAQAVGEQIAAQKPDISLHLGDVYYAGTAEQEKANLIDIWPTGSQGAYTLNSNHEMYNGALSYFDALNTHFTDQGGCSYFALENQHWLIIGLDSAYHSDPWNLYMDGKLSEAQIDWLKALPPKAGIIISSHHTGSDLAGDKQQALYAQVMDALQDSQGRSRYPQVYWYWGHAHNAVVYQDQAIPGGQLKTRCVGHAAIPYGKASALQNAAKVSWYETQSANDPKIPERVLCGFAQIELKGETLNERLIGEDGSTRWQP